MQVLFIVSDVGSKLILSSLKMKTVVSPSCNEGFLLLWDVVVGKIGNYAAGYGTTLVYMLGCYFLIVCFCTISKP